MLKFFRNLHVFSEDKSCTGALGNLAEMDWFCQNYIDCRRNLLLSHLGERTDINICNLNIQTQCDNCMCKAEYVSVDFTQHCKDLANLIHNLSNNTNITCHNIIDIYRGDSHKSKKISRENICLKNATGIPEVDIYRCLKQLFELKIIIPYWIQNGKYPITYVKSGPEYKVVNDSECKLLLTFNIFIII